MSSFFTTNTAKEEAERDASIAVLPVGSCEQHGAHLPITTDALIAGLIATEIASTYELLLLPPITISCSHEHAAWRGTVSISSRTLRALILDIAESLSLSGVHRLLIVNGHGGNYVLSNVVQEASAKGPTMALFPTGDEWSEARRAAGIETDGHTDMHGGELETSILLHALPEVVRDGYEQADHRADDRQHLLTLGMSAYTQTGIIGVPSLATPEKGKAAVAALTALAAGSLTSLGWTPILD